MPYLGIVLGALWLILSLNMETVTWYTNLNIGVTNLSLFSKLHSIIHVLMVLILQIAQSFDYCNHWSDPYYLDNLFNKTSLIN